jgi:hypothetical protein
MKNLLVKAPGATPPPDARPPSPPSEVPWFPLLPSSGTIV